MLTYTIPEAIRELKTSRNTLYEAIARGDIRTYCIGRRRYISGDALQEYIRAREAEAQQQSAA